MPLTEITTVQEAPQTHAESYAFALLAAYLAAVEKLQRHRGDCAKMTKTDLRTALIENSLKLKVALAEARLIDEIESQGGSMTIGGRPVRIEWATIGGDRRRRKWVVF